MVKFMLDPGHDENTPGKGVAGLREFHFNRAVVEKMVNLLKQYEGVEVFISHDMYDGIDQSLSQRVNLANSLKVDCFCSVHANAASSPEARGIETFVDPQAPKDTVNLGAVVHGELIRATGLNNRGLKRADFYVLDKTKMNAFLAECGFMTNAADLAKLKDDGYRYTCAQAIVNGLVQHYKLKKKAAQVSIAATAAGPSPSVVYEAHVQDIGWQGKKRNGETAGTSGQYKRLEALTVKLENTDAKLEMQAHIQDKGWTPVRTNGEVLGTIGEGLRLEAIAINCNKHTITYRVHIEGLGWTNWMKNGEGAGTTGKGLRIEAIEIKLG